MIYYLITIIFLIFGFFILSCLIYLVIGESKEFYSDFENDDLEVKEK